MSTVLYTVTSREMLFNGTHNVEDMHKDSDYWYEGNDREKSLELARKYSNDTIEVNKSGILRDVYQWNAFEFENDVCTGYRIKIFDPLDQFKTFKKFATRARAHDCDMYSYIVGDREWMGNFTLNGHVCDLYRYTDTAFGDFTAYREEGNLWLPETFSDYAILKPTELMLAMGEGVTFWQDWQTDDPETRLFYKIFQNN